MPKQERAHTLMKSMPTEHVLTEVGVKGFYLVKFGVIKVSN